MNVLIYSVKQETYPNPRVCVQLSKISALSPPKGLSAAFLSNFGVSLDVCS